MGKIRIRDSEFRGRGENSEFGNQISERKNF
jgi:hypothetical protein